MNKIEILRQQCTEQDIEISDSDTVFQLEQKLQAKSVEGVEKANNLLIPPGLLKEHTSGYSEQDIAMREAQRLIRVRVTCMNPKKSDYTSVIMSTGNSVIPTQTHAVPLGTPWHVPNMLLDVMRESIFQTYQEKKNEAGKLVKIATQNKEFAIEVLEPLSSTELDELAQEQRNRATA